jgi:hypothetical protein
MSESPPAWLQWLNTAPVPEIAAEARRELGTGADTSKLLTRVVGAIRAQRATQKPFEDFAHFAAMPNIGKRTRRLMERVLARHGYDGPPIACLRCPLHCPEAHG